MLRRLIYSSRATREMSKEDLLQMLEAARIKNLAKGITGMLVFANNDFLQALEGEHDALEALYETISDDPRNKLCRILSDTEIQERIFPDWSMGFLEIDKADLTQRPGFVDFFNPDMTPKTLVNPTSAAQFFLLGFRGLQLENENKA